MPARDRVLHIAAAAVLGFALPGCIDVPGADPLVFSDSFVDNQYQRFGDALGDIAVDPTEKISGFASLKITVPSDGCPGSNATHFCYAGGALVANSPRDLSKYNALTFWAKASAPGARLAEVGFGNDNTGLSKYTASAHGVALFTSWTKYYLPIPLPAKLPAEKGLFFFAAGNNAGVGYDLWVDAVQFEQVGPGLLGPPRPSIPNATVNRKVGAAIAITGTSVTWAVNGVDQTMSAMPSYFTWTSSDASVATVGEGGTGVARAFGTAIVTASLGSFPADGQYQVTVPGGSTQPVPQQVFSGGFIDADFQAFGNALGTISVSATQTREGRSTLDITVPNDGCPGVSATRFCYTGGALVAGLPQDLSPFNALTFWAKATNPAAKFDVAGLGNDNTGTSLYTASVSNLKLTTDWVKYVLPVPLSAKLINERGLFFFAASNDGGVGYDVFLDDLRFENVGAPVLGPPHPSIPGANLTRPVGSAFKVGDASVTFAVSGAFLTMSLTPSYFTWTSSNPKVATVGPDGSIVTVGPGSATVSAALGTVPASGQVGILVLGGATTAGPLVFNDDFVDDSFQPFANALGTAHADTAQHHTGLASLNIAVPSNGCPGSDANHYCYAGGAVVANSPRDLSSFNAVTFWALASVPAQFDLVGLGNDNSGTSRYTASWSNVAIGTAWAKYYLPIPLPAKLTAEKGLLFFAASNRAGAGYSIWLDDVQFEQVDASILGPPRPALPNLSVNAKPGAALALSASVTFAVNGVDEVISAAPGYLAWTSSDSSVAQINADGTGVAGTFGTSTLTATLGAVPATGTLTIVVPGGSGCPAQPCTLPGPLQVFSDSFVGNGFQAFGNALGTLSVNTDPAQVHAGTASIHVHVPSDLCAGADASHFCYAGGALVASTPQDLSLFNALTFWAKATNPSGKFGTAGFGNDNTGTSKYTVTATNLTLSSTWKKFTVPIPLAAKLSAEKGFFWFSANNIGSYPNGVGYDIYADDVQFELITDAAVLGPPQPALAPQTLSKVVGDTFSVGINNTTNPATVYTTVAYAGTFAVNGVSQTFSVLPSYFSWASSDPTVASIAGDGTGAALKVGASTITAKLGTVSATGAATVNVH